jgi:hypothetical protein
VEKGGKPTTKCIVLSANWFKIGGISHCQSSFLLHSLEELLVEKPTQNGWLITVGFPPKFGLFLTLPYLERSSFPPFSGRKTHDFSDISTPKSTPKEMKRVPLKSSFLPLSSGKHCKPIIPLIPSTPKGMKTMSLGGVFAKY